MEQTGRARVERRGGGIPVQDDERPLAADPEGHRPVLAIGGGQTDRGLVERAGAQRCRGP